MKKECVLLRRTFLTTVLHMSLKLLVAFVLATSPMRVTSNQRSTWQLMARTLGSTWLSVPLVHVGILVSLVPFRDNSQDS